MRRATVALMASAAMLLVPAGLAAQSDEDAAISSGPAYFSGTAGEPAFRFEGETTFEAGVWQDMRGGEIHEIPLETSDPRFTGDWSVAVHRDEWPVELGETATLVNVERNTVRLENDGGSWAGQGTLITGVVESELMVNEGLFELEGQGGYEGLTAYVVLDFTEPDAVASVEGVIIPEPPTEFPDPPTASR